MQTQISLIESDELWMNEAWQPISINHTYSVTLSWTPWPRSNKSLFSEYPSLGNKGLWWPLKQAVINQEKLFIEWGESGFKHGLSFWPLRHNWSIWGSTWLRYPFRELQAELPPLSTNAGHAFSGMLPLWWMRAGTPLMSNLNLRPHQPGHLLRAALLSEALPENPLFPPFILVKYRTSSCSPSSLSLTGLSPIYRVHF